MSVSRIKGGGGGGAMDYHDRTHGQLSGSEPRVMIFSKKTSMWLQ